MACAFEINMPPNEPKNRFLPYPLDEESQEIIWNAVLTRLRDAISDTIWRTNYYYSSLFESLDRYGQSVPATGAIGLADEGLVLDSSSVNGEDCRATLYVNETGVLNVQKRTRFRAGVQIDNVANVLFTLRSLAYGTSAYIGFEISSSALKGTSKDGTTEKTVTLLASGDLVVDTFYFLEWRYTPTDGIIFLVDGVERGRINANLPEAVAGDEYIFDVNLETTNSVQHSAIINRFEYMQETI